jgi:hypothetical protein
MCELKLAMIAHRVVSNGSERRNHHSSDVCAKRNRADWAGAAAAAS